MKIIWVITERNREDDDGDFNVEVLGVAGTEAARDRMTQPDATWDSHKYPADRWRIREADEYEVLE